MSPQGYEDSTTTAATTTTATTMKKELLQCLTFAFTSTTAKTSVRIASAQGTEIKSEWAVQKVFKIN